MKALPGLLIHYLRNRTSRRNLAILLRFFAVLVGMVAVYSVAFHFLMAREGQEYSWITGVYWTLTVMSTLGFGDITFDSDLGRLFSLLVLLSGVVFLLVMLPFTFIQFFYEPWMKAQTVARVPTSLPEETRGHVVLTRYGPITSALIERLTQYHYPYVVILADFDEALDVLDQGIAVMHGHLDDPETYRKARVESAALVATTETDIVNTSVAFTVREVSERVPIVATAREPSAVEILKVAGCSRVLQLSDLMGRTLARRTRVGTSTAHVIGELEEVLIAEANAAETSLVGKTLSDSDVRDTAGVTVVGVWERGQFEIARPDTVIGANTVLVLAGSRDQLARFDELCASSTDAVSDDPVLIIGGGRVGRATASALGRRGIACRIIERRPDLAGDPDLYVVGDATDPDTLERAGIATTPVIIITTHDDDTNVYLSIYCRRVRPDAQIISRATVERKVATLHRAGCNFVHSYATMGANTLFNLLKRTDVLMVAEGLNVFKVPVPGELAGRTIAETDIRAETGCSIVAIDADTAGTVINPPPGTTLFAGTEIVVIGTVEAENRFVKRYASE